MSDLTPSVLTVMAGLQQGSALMARSLAVNLAINSMTTTANNLSQSQNVDTQDWANTICASRDNLISMADNIWAGSPTGFGTIIAQVMAHVSAAKTLKKSTDFIGSTGFGDYGTGVTNMGSVTTQGIDSHFGSLTAASAVMAAVGPIYDLSDIKNFGSSVGVVKKLNAVKLGNASGVNAALVKNGVDTGNLEDPVYKDAIDKTLASITDATVIATVVEQLGITPAQPLTSLLDLTNINKLVPAASLTGLKVSLSDMATKFNDMGASFTSPTQASSMLSKLATPSLPNLNSSTDLSALTSTVASGISNAVGVGAGAGGLPNVTDFTEPVSGGANIAAINTIGVTPTTVAAINAMVTASKNLFALAGINITVHPQVGLTSIKSVASMFPAIGADTSGSNAANVITSMVTSDMYGDAVIAAMAEGKNKDTMAAAGIKPLNFTG